MNREDARRELKPKHWYWIRRTDGSLAPYVFHRMRADEIGGGTVAEFFVGSFIQTFQISQIIGQAEMPGSRRPESMGGASDGPMRNSDAS